VASPSVGETGGDVEGGAGTGLEVTSKGSPPSTEFARHPVLNKNPHRTIKLTTIRKGTSW